MNPVMPKNWFLTSLCLVVAFSVGSMYTTSAQTIKVASIDKSRLDNGATDKGFTLNGLTMEKTATPKLLNNANFGPGGTVPYSLNITHTFTTSGSITATTLAPFDILFIGVTFRGTLPITIAEQEAIKIWSTQPGKVVIVAEQPINPVVTTYYGYTLSNGNKNPSTVGPGDAITKLFSGVFGNATSISQGGTSQGYFSTDCFTTVLAQNVDKKPTIIFNSSTRDILIADTDFFTTFNVMSVGATIDNSNDTDKVWGNLWAWAVKEVLNPGTPSDPIAATVSAVCKGNDGTISFTSPLGSSNGQPYQYSIDGKAFQESPIFLNLSPGAYKLYSRTSLDCPTTSGGTVIINASQAAPTIGAITQPSCGSTSGSVNLTGLPVTGTYIINRNPGGVITSTGNSTVYIDTNVPPGVYTYNIANAAGCTSPSSTTVSILPSKAPQIISIETKNSNCGKADGEVKINANGGTGTLFYSIDGNTFSEQPIIKNLSAKQYRVTVKDATNCLSFKDFEISQTDKLIIAKISVTSASCDQANGSINITTAGGVLPIGYRLDSNNFQNNNIFTLLKPGVHKIVIMDSVGCTSDTTLKIESSPLPKIDSLKATKAECGLKNGTITVYATGASSLTYYLGSNQSQTTPLFANLNSNTYTINVIDMQGCSVKDTIMVNEDCSQVIQSVSIPTAFTPNNDRTNDTWNIYFKQKKLNVLTLKIFNRWGNPVYLKNNFELSSGDALWNGFVDGEIGLEGIFTYILEVQFDNQEKYTYKNFVHIIK